MILLIASTAPTLIGPASANPSVGDAADDHDDLRVRPLRAIHLVSEGMSALAVGDETRVGQREIGHRPSGSLRHECRPYHPVLDSGGVLVTDDGDAQRPRAAVSRPASTSAIADAVTTAPITASRSGPPEVFGVADSRFTGAFDQLRCRRLEAITDGAHAEFGAHGCLPRSPIARARDRIRAGWTRPRLPAPGPSGR